MARLRNLTDLQKLSLDIVKGKVEKYSANEGSDVIRQAILEACGMENGWDVYKFQQNKYEVYRMPISCWHKHIVNKVTGILRELITNCHHLS